jgi:ferredoxin/flavodoxin---NADP+ reductase
MNREKDTSSSELLLFKTTVIGQKEIVPGVFILSLNRLHDFEAGQFVALGLKMEGPSRLYSIASGILNDNIDLLYDVKPEGLLTPSLTKLKAGEEVYISKPFGSFYCDEKPAWWIAAGTGIAPFASMFFSGLYHGKVLIHGGKTKESFYFQEAFLPTMGKNYVRCCSQESGEGLYEGRLTKYLNELKEIPSDIKFYLCGSVEMVIEVRDILITRGIPYSSILAEIFF